MIFKLKTKTITAKTQVYIYGGQSFFLQIWLYRLLLTHKLKLTFITPDFDFIKTNPKWQFFTSHPNLTLLNVHHLTKAQTPAPADFFIDTAFLSLYENLDRDIKQQVDTSFGILNRLSFAFQSKSKYVLLFPLIRNLNPEINLYFQIAHHQSFLQNYTKAYPLSYKIIQLTDYLSPNLLTQSTPAFLSIVLHHFFSRQATRLSPATSLYLADLSDQINLIEKISFGFSSSAQHTLLGPKTSLSDFYTNLAQITNQKPPEFIAGHSINPQPIILSPRTTPTQSPRFTDLKKIIQAVPSIPKNLRPCPARPAASSPAQIKLNPNTPPESLPRNHSAPTSSGRLKLGRKLRSLFNASLFRTPRHRFNLKYVLLTLSLSFLIILTPLSLLLFHILNGLQYLAPQTTSPNQTQEVIKQSQLAAASLKRAKSTNQLISPFLSALGLSSTSDNLREIIDFFILVAQTNQHIAQLPDTTNQLFDYIFDRRLDLKSFSWYYTRLSRQNHQAFTAVNQALAVYQDKLQTYSSIKTFNIGPKISQTYKHLKSTQQNLEISQKIISQLPELLGYNKRKEYLIVLMDNNELRPSGGLITAYAVLTIENGQLLDFQVNDTYMLDNQLKGRIPPPPALQTYLGQLNWSIKDAAWYPGFPDTSRQLIWFYSKAMGQEIDGVIAVDLNFFQQIAGSLDNFYLPDLNLNLDSKNLTKRAYLWGNLTDGNQNEIFVSLLKTFLLKFKNLNSQNAPAFFSRMLTAAQQKSLRFYFNNTNLQATMSQLKFAGSVQFPQCQNKCLLVGGLIDQANLGANRVNYLLQQRISVSLDIQNDQLIQKISLFIKNPAVSPKWPGGDFKDYLTLHAPSNWQLTQVKISDRALDLDKVEIATQSSFVSYQLFHQVPFGQNQTVTFTLKSPLPTAPNLDSIFFFIKQPGIKNTNLIFEITSSASKSLKIISPKTWQKLTNKAIYQQKLDKDIIVPVRIKVK
ncbi:MAG: DUF4012 domain-containing protein [bacterium]|nr:DUF4012 domain-containing protein [bacterium]